MIRILGGFEVISFEGLPLALPTRKARALLAVLAYRVGEPISRERIAHMLWGLSGEDQARASLRQTLSSVRKALGPDAGMLVSEGDVLFLDANRVDVDLSRLRELTASGDPDEMDRAIDLTRGDLLEGLDLREEGYEAWIEAERPRARELLTRVMRRCLERLASLNDNVAAIELARRLLELDPFDESAHRDLMRLFAGVGRRPEALRQFERLREVLRRELATEPAPETVALASELRRTVDQEHPAEEPSAAASVFLETSAPTSAEAPAWAEGEVRQVAVLCARFEIQPADERDDAVEAIYRVMEPVLAHAESIVRDFGGEAHRQPGTRLLAMFGIPVSHGNDVERAVRAALVLQSPGKMTGPLGHAMVSCGVAAGRAVAAASAVSDHDATRVAGAPVSEAIRLEETAEPGVVIVSDAVKILLDDGLELDGDSREAPEGGRMWRVREFRATARDARHSPIVGRGSELRQVETVVQQSAGESAGAVLLIRGEPGIGKTRLVQEIDRVGRQAGFARHAVQVLDFGVQQSERAISMLAARLLGAPRSQVEWTAAISAAENPIEADQHAFVYDLLGLAPPEKMRALYDAMDNTARKQGVAEVLCQLVEARAHDTPLILVIEDIHWADRLTMDLLGAVARGSKDLPVVLVMTTRTAGNPVDQVWRTAARGAQIITLDLAPLRDSDAGKIAKSYPELNEKLVFSCIARAEGNPLFLEQLFKNIKDRGAGDIPASIQSLVQARIDELAPDVRYAMQAASTLGQRFTLDALQHLLEDREVEAAALERSFLVLPDGGGYVFTHALIRDATYASLLGTTRRQLHQSAALWFSGRDAMLHAEHLGLAEDASAPLAYLEASREQAQAYRLDQALQVVDRGLEIASSAEDCVSLSLFKGEILLDIGEIRGSIDTYRQATELAQSDIQLCRGLVGMAAGMRISDELDAALEILDRAQQLAEAGAHRLELANIHFLRGSLCFPLGRVEQCLEEQLQALEHARCAEDPEIEARVFSGLGDAYYAIGRLRTAKDNWTKCVELADKLGFGRISVSNLSQVGSAKKLLLDLDAGLADCRKAEEFARKVGADRAELNAHHSAAEILLELGDAASVQHHIDRVDVLIDKLGAKRFMSRARHYRAKALLIEGKRDQALALLEHARELSLETSPGYVGPLVCAAIALATTDPGRRADALVEGLRLLNEGAVFHNVIEYHRDAIDALLENGDWVAVEQHAAALDEAMRQEPLPYTNFFAARGRALAAHGRGNRGAKTKDELTRLRVMANRVGMRAALPAIEGALNSW
jgi:DNA-binding SARP family transcriptional activator/predicted negative regulator of RcsB-dependent stress response